MFIKNSGRHLLGLFIASSATAFLFQNCSPMSFKTADLSSEILASQSDCATNPNETECNKACIFNGQEYPEGSSIRAYMTSSVSGGGTCASEERRCVNGNFTGSYLFATCSVNAPAACLFNGRTISSGSTARAYQSSTVPFGQNCASENRLCTNGALSGSYIFDTCLPGAAASCSFNGRAIAHGQTVTAYQSSNSAAGQSCVSQIRTCNNGSLSGSYTFGSCTASPNASCLFNGQTINHGQSVTAYARSYINFGESCTAELRTCTNGSLSGSYSFTSCAIGAAASCNFNGQVISHGQSITAYASQSVNFGSVCSSQVRTCNNGSLLGSYSYSSCSVGAAAQCNFNGQTINHGDSVTAYASASVASGQTCQAQQRQCNNGALSGSYTSSACTVAAAASCSFGGGALNWGAYQCSVNAAAETVAHGATRTFASTSATGAGDITYSCNNGNFAVQGSSCSPKRCETLVSQTKCMQYTYCANGALIAAQTVYPMSSIAMSGAIGESVGTSLGQVSILDSSMTLIQWDNLTFKCNASGWQQTNDGWCTVRTTIPDSDPRCQSIGDYGGGGS